MHFGRKMKKAAKFGNKGAKKGFKFAGKAGKIVEDVGRAGEVVGVPGSGELVMAGRKTQQVSNQLERVRSKAARASRMV